MLCIGLFGTCGGSSWRTAFIEAYQKLGIEHYNPQVEDWRPELAQIEAEHLLNDEIILFPVTDETYGTGSLAETGFSILQTVNSSENRSVVILIHKDVKEELKIANPALAKESMRSRALVNAHLSKIKKNNVYIVDTLEDMLNVSLKLYEVHSILRELKLKS